MPPDTPTAPLEPFPASATPKEGPMTATAIKLKPAERRIPYFRTETTVDVDIDPDDLRDAGWHHEYECPAGPRLVLDDAPPDKTPPLEIIPSLHRQAHPSQGPHPVTCHEEPCRSLTLDQLRRWR